MNTTSDLFQPVEGLKDVFVAQSGKLACIAFRLSHGGLCLYSPLRGMSKEAIAGLQDLGEVGILLAPNHYHNRGLAEHVELFPNADLVCSPGAKPRLEKQTGFQFEGMDNFLKSLPKHISMLEPEGLKTGEIWLQIKGRKELAWIVCDAFSSVASKSARSQSNGYSNEPSLLGTFPKFGVANREVYKAWVKKRISAQAPSVIVPCHGAPVKRAGLGKALVKLLDESL